MFYRSGFIVIFCMLTQSAFAENWTGAWVFVYGPGAMPSVLDIRKKGNEVTVDWDGESVKDVTVEGNRIHIPNGSAPNGFDFTGTVRGDDLVLTSRYMVSANYNGEDMKEVQYIHARRVPVAQRQKLDSIISRRVIDHKLPVPILHDVPDNGLVRTPPMGWGNWVGTNDKTVREIADAMVSQGFRDAGYVYLVIDSGWQGYRDAQGKIHANENFRNMKALADYVHARGLRLGLYSSPGPLDCTRRLGSYGYEREDAQSYAQWGVDYLKYDWCSAADLYKTRGEMQALFQKMGEALQASGRPIVYSICQYGLFNVGEWGRKVGGNLWRTTLDINNNFASVTDNGFDKNGATGNAGPGGWNDPDDLQIGKGMTADEDRTQMTLWAIIAAPLLMSGDPRSVEPLTKEILLNKEVIDVDQDAAGNQGRRVKVEVMSEIWVKSLSNGSMAVGLFNRGRQKAEIDVRWADLGLKNDQIVRDLWRHADLGRLADGYRLEVPAHGAVLLRLQNATAVQ